jgi:hypothetical protein
MHRRACVDRGRNVPTIPSAAMLSRKTGIVSTDDRLRKERNNAVRLADGGCAAGGAVGAWAGRAGGVGWLSEVGERESRVAAK